MQVTPATTYDTVSAGPAVLCAAAPVATKIPAPITAPTPNAVKLTGPSARFSRFSLSISASRSFSFLVANSCFQDIQTSSGGSERATTSGKQPIPGELSVVKYRRGGGSVKRKTGGHH